MTTGAGAGPGTGTGTGTGTGDGPADSSVEDEPTDWLLRTEERGNPRTRLDDGHPAGTAWSEGNLVRPLVHGATYFRELFDRIEATRDGDLLFFTDWAGDADERLTGDPGSEVAEVLGRADERGVDVRGLVWRSHLERFGFTSRQNRKLGQQLQARGAEALLDMRVRMGGSHHQKMLLIRHRDDPARDIAFIGGVDLCHGRRDDADHGGDPQPFDLPGEYGPTPPWHDVQAAITGPAVHDAETVFRERWEDPTPLTRSPLRWFRDRRTHLDMTPDPLPPQTPPPPPVEGGTHVVQLLRTYPDLRLNRDYPFARGGERSIARGYSKAIERARQIVYVEDQYLWGHRIGKVFTQALRDHPELRVVAVVPLLPDVGGWNREAQLLGRRRAMLDMMRAGPGRVAYYGIENPQATPVYVHAKVCIIDDAWATIGSDNFNRRSWTHDSELSAVVVDRERTEDGASAYARRLRLALAAEHLGRGAPAGDSPLEELRDLVGDCVSPEGHFAAFEQAAAELDAWHDGGRQGPRPQGRLRRLQVPEMGVLTRMAALPPYLAVHDPDGRPRRLRITNEY